jgi:hypothetical protein
MKFMVLLFMVVAVNAYTGDYVTYVDPKTGARFYGDVAPPDVPTSKIEVRSMKGNLSSAGPSSGWNETAKGIAPKIPVKPPEPVVKQIQVQQVQQNGMAAAERAWHMGSKPRKPESHPAFRDFNRATDQWGQYEDKMFEWRAKGRELGIR